jgi:hypothetical protein
MNREQRINVCWGNRFREYLVNRCKRDFCFVQLIRLDGHHSKAGPHNCVTQESAKVQQDVPPTGGREYVSRSEVSI